MEVVNWSSKELAMELTALEDLALSITDGHFTIMRFTKNWRICLGTVNGNFFDILIMSEGATLIEAIRACIFDYNAYGLYSISDAWNLRRNNVLAAAERMTHIDLSDEYRVVKGKNGECALQGRTAQ